MLSPEVPSKLSQVISADMLNRVYQDLHYYCWKLFLSFPYVFFIQLIRVRKNSFERIAYLDQIIACWLFEWTDYRPERPFYSTSCQGPFAPTPYLQVRVPSQEGPELVLEYQLEWMHGEAWSLRYVEKLCGGIILTRIFLCLSWYSHRFKPNTNARTWNAFFMHSANRKAAVQMLKSEACAGNMAVWRVPGQRLLSA